MRTENATLKNLPKCLKSITIVAVFTPNDAYYRLLTKKN